MKSSKSYKKLYDLAINNNHELVSTEYEGLRCKMVFRCSKGHIFEKTPEGYKLRPRCTVCSNRYVKDIDEVRTIIESKGYTLLSNKYINSKTPIEIKCGNCGETSMIKLTNFKNMKMCSKCTPSRKKTYSEVKQLIEGIGYKLLSTEYINNHSKLLLQCDRGHFFQSTYADLRSGNNCQFCTRENLSHKFKIEYSEVKSYIENLGFNLISSHYGNCKSPIQVQCTEGHIFITTYDNFKNKGNRCPMCNESSGEQMVRAVLKKHNLNFKSQYVIDECRNIKPLPFDFAIFDGTDNLVALIEYQGEFHYGVINGLSDEIMYAGTVIRDAIKKKYCSINGIPLIVIPHWEFDNIEHIIQNKLLQNEQEMIGVG